MTAAAPTAAAAPSVVGRGGAALLAVGSVVVGLLNYAASLAAVHLLLPGAFSAAASAQALLLVVGTAATASMPWVVTQVLERRGTGPRERREVVWFSLLVNVLQGVVAALVVLALTASSLTPAGAGLASLAAVLVFVATTPAGVLQGDRRFAALAALRVTEATVKVVVVVVLLRSGTGPTGVAAGIAAGAAVSVLVGGLLCRGSIAVVRGALRLRGLWRTGARLVTVQVLVAALVSLDVLLVERLVGDPVEAGSYQAAAVLGKAPLFVAGALAAVDFGRLTAARSVPGAPLRSTSVGVLLLLCLPAVALTVSVPPRLLDLAVPEAYVAVGPSLPVAAVVGTAAALLTVVTTCRLGLEVPGAAHRLAVAAVAALAASVAGDRLAGALGLALALALVLGTSAVVLARPATGVLGPSRTTWAGALLLAVLALAAGRAATDRPLVWCGVATAAVLAALLLVRRELRDPGAPGGSTTPSADPRSPRPRVLHLAFEDHHRPGSGGGSLRTWEVDRRLAEDFDVTVVTTTWRGAVDRTEGGVRYRHVGLPGGYLVEVVTYFLALPLLVRRTTADVVVEDFAAPLSTLGVQRWTQRPVVGVVQWLNAREKSAQYHLPLHRVELSGVRRHTRLVAVSEGVAVRLRAMNPRAEVHVLPNGVEPEAFEVVGDRGQDVVFLGRIEVAQKGLDVLLRAWALVEGDLPGRLVLAGDGPDEASVRRLVRALGLGPDRVVLVGRVAREDRLDLLRRARLTVMPSRFETFGLVALESLAVGTPVLATDIPCLRDVVVPGPGVLVPVDDVEALAAAMLGMAGDQGLAGRHEAAARAWAARFGWDAVADAQAEVLRSAL